MTHTMEAELIDDDFKFITPFTCILSGSSGSGKSTIQLNFLKHHEELMDKKPEHIYYIYNDFQPEFQSCTHLASFFKGWNHPELHPDYLSQKRNILMLVDDSGDTVQDKSFLKLIFCKFSHHRGWNIILSLHNCFDPSIKDLRTISL